MLGTPNDSERSFINDEKALQYLKHYPQKYGKDLRVMFPGAPLEALDILKKMLKFNPNQRITLDECL
jgi:mitogen-activated protein kinase 1/3